MGEAGIAPCPLQAPGKCAVALKSPFSREVLTVSWDRNAKEYAPLWTKIINLDNIVDEKGEKIEFVLPGPNKNIIADLNWRNDFEKAVNAFNTACEMMSGSSIESPSGTPSSTRSSVNLWRRCRCDEDLIKLVSKAIFSGLSQKTIEELSYTLQFLLDLLYHQDVVSILGPYSDLSTMYVAGTADVRRIYGAVVDPTPAKEAVAQFEKLMRYFGKCETPFDLFGNGYSPYKDDCIKESTVFFVNNAPMDKNTEKELVEFIAKKVKKTARIITTKAIPTLANHGLKMDKREKRHRNKIVLHIYTFKRTSTIPRLTTDAFTSKRSPPDSDYEPKEKRSRVKISNYPVNDQIPNIKCEQDVFKCLDDSIACLQSVKDNLIEENDSKRRLQEILAERECTIKKLEDQIRSSAQNFEKKKIALEENLEKIKAELRKQEEDLFLVNAQMEERKQTADNDKATLIEKQKEELEELKLRIEALESTREAKPQTSTETEQLLRNKINELSIVKLDRYRLQKQLAQSNEDYHQLLTKVLNNGEAATPPANKEPKEEPP